MARKRNAPIPFDATIGEMLAKVMDVKRRLIEAGIQSGDLGAAREIFEGVFAISCAAFERIWRLNCATGTSRT